MLVNDTSRAGAARDRAPAGSWLGFFDQGQRVIHHPRLLEARYIACADDLLRIMPTLPDMQLLDFGCGDALATARYLTRGMLVTLYDASAHVREALHRRYKHLQRVQVLDSGAYERLEASQFDVILVHSVIQYIPCEALPALLRRWSTLLKPGGLLIVSDVLTPRGGRRDDAVSLLRFGLQKGMFLPAMSSLVRTFFSIYRALNRGPGLTRYSDDELKWLLRSTGFRVEVLPANPGPFRKRRAFRATRPL